MTKYRRRTPDRLSTFETLLDKVVSEIFPRSNRPKFGGLGKSRRAAKAKRQDFALEAMEPRLLLSADLTYTSLHNAPTSGSTDAQVVFLETDGATDVDYRGPVIVEDIDVASFVVPDDLVGERDDALQALTTALNDVDFGLDVLFTTERPDEGEYSTIYIGGTGSEFAQWGDYLGLAEGIDLGNADRSDDAFVFSGSISADGLSAAEYGAQVAVVVAHEIEHLLGVGHAHDDADGNPLTAVAFDPKVHVAIGTDAADDAVDDGQVTIDGREYTVHPLIVDALTDWRSYYNAGAVAGDGFPDVLMGQVVIHPIDNGTWLTRVLDMAWQAQGDASYTAAEKSQILAWSYGFVSHSAADHFAHSLVNQFAEGVAPGFGAAAASLPGDQRDLGNQLRHLMTEAYIADALPGFDANRTDRTEIVPGDFTDDTTPAIAYDAPVRFIYETLLRAFPDDPTPIVEMKWGKGQLEVDAATDTFTRTEVGLLLDGFVHDGFKVGQKITVSGFSNAANNGTFLVTGVTKTTLSVSGALADETASGDESIVVRIAKTAPVLAGQIVASATDNTFTRSDGGSFLADGFVEGMRFDALGMTLNYRTYTVKTVTANVLTVVGGHVTETALFAAGELEADAATNSFTRSDVGGSFLADGFVEGMTFTAPGMALNNKTYVIESVDADTITVTAGELVDETGGAGAQLVSVGQISELKNEVAVAGVQLVGVGQRGPALDTVLKLRAAVFEKAVEKGARGDANELGVLASQLIDTLVNGDDIGDALKADLFRAYLYNWVDEIDEAVRHWAEFGLAFTKAMFDAGSRRELQQKVGAETGFADSADPTTIRSRAEDGVGFLDVLIEELDDPNGDGSTFDSFINKHLLPIFGLPAELGLLRSGIQSVTSEFEALLQPFENLFNPIEVTVDNVKTFVKDFVKKQIGDKFGVDFEVFEQLMILGNKMDLESITIAGNIVPFFKPGDHEKLDLLLGLPADHHDPADTLEDSSVPGLSLQFYDDAEGRLNSTAVMNETSFAAYANAVTLTKMMLLMESPAGDLVAGAGTAAGQLSALYSDILTELNGGTATTYNFANLNLHGAHGGNVMTATLPGVAGVADGQIWLTSIDADQVWRADNYTVTNTLFRISTTGEGSANYVTYEASGLTPGDEYKIYVSWQANVTQKLDNLGDSNHPDQFISPTETAEYIVEHGGGAQTFHENQTLFSNDRDDGGLGFEQLGATASTTFTVDAAGKLTVKLNNLDGTGQHHVIAGPVLFQKVVGGVDSGSAFRVQNNRDPQTLAAVATPNRVYSEPAASVWTDIVYDIDDHGGGGGNDPLWESALLRPVFRELFIDWLNGALDFPNLGDATTADPNDGSVVQFQLPSHATPFGPVVPDHTLQIAIPEALEDAILSGLDLLVDFAALVDDAPPMQVVIPGINKKLGEIIHFEQTVQVNLQQPIVDFFTPGVGETDATPRYFSDLFDVISPSLGAWGSSDISAIEFNLDLRAAFAAVVPLSLGAAADDAGLDLDVSLDVGASVAFVDSATTSLPVFAFGVDLAGDLALADRFYIRAETLQLHAEVHVEDLDLAARLAFLSIGVQDGSIDLDVDVSINLAALDTNSNGKITLTELPDLVGDLVPVATGTLSGVLPISASLAGLTLPASPEITFGATDVFDFDTYSIDFTGVGLDALNFGNIDAAGIVSLIGRLADELDNLRDSGFFDDIDIAFVDGAISAVLRFADAVKSGLLYDQGADDLKDAADRLLSDLNAALATAGLDTAIIVQGDGTTLTFQIIDPTIDSFKIERESGALSDFTAAGLGFVVTDADDFDTEHTATPGDGIIGGDIVLRITIRRDGVDEVVFVTVTANATANNIAIGDDKIKLLRADNSATFDTVQSLVFRLSTILGLGGAVAYDPATDALTINLGALLPRFEVDEDFALKLDLDDFPLLGFHSDTTVNVHAEVGFDQGFTIGVYLGDTVPGALANLSDGTGATLATPLDVLNDAEGVDIKTEPAFTAPDAVISTIRQLSGNATFEISFGTEAAGDASSGTSTQLNDVGQNFVGKVSVGDTVFNITDGSSARVLAVTATQLTLTPLTGGSDNTWSSGDLYRTAHVVTVAQYAGVPATDVNVSQAGGDQLEVTIAVNPLNSLNIIIGVNDNSSIFGDSEETPAVAGTDGDADGDDSVAEPDVSQNRVWVTTDGGLIWTPVVIPMPAGAIAAHGDPTITFNRAGLVLYTQLINKSVGGNGQHGGGDDDDHVIMAAVSSNGGLNWTAAQVTPDDADVSTDDKQFVAVGPKFGDLSKDQFVVAWQERGVIYSATSTDGLSWSAPVQVGDEVAASPGALPAGSSIDSIPAVGPNGEIYIVWEDTGTAGVSLLKFDVSLDGGLTWGTDKVIYTGYVNAFRDPFDLGRGQDGVDEGTGAAATDGLGDYEIPAQPNRGIWMGLSIDVDRSGGPKDGRIYVAFADQGDRDGDDDADSDGAGGPDAADNATDHHNTDIFVIASDNQGGAWTALGANPVRVNDDTGSASQFFAWLDVDQQTGNVGISWYDARNDSGAGLDELDTDPNTEVQYFASYSTDGGVTWAKNIQVADKKSLGGNSTPNNFGDYTGMAFFNNTIHMTWADNSDTPSNLDLSTDIFYDSIPLGNQNLADLLVDINRAIADLPALAGKIQAVADGNRIILKALLPSITGFGLTTAQADPAVKDLGFANSQAATGPLVGDSLDTFALASGDAHFTLTVAGVSYAVTVAVADTALNTTIDHLVTDVNAALLAALPMGLDNKIVAAKSGTALVLRIADASIVEVGFSAEIDDPAVLELGLSNEATITQPRLEAVKDLGLLVGRLPADATITITTTDGTGPSGSVTLFADDTATNTTILSLVNDLNKVLSTPTLKTGVLTSFAPTTDVTFSIAINGGLDEDVTLLADDMADNISLSDLVEDINAALAAAGLSASVTAKSSGTNSNLGNARIKFEGNANPLDPDFVSLLEITADPGNALNLPTSAAATNFAGHIVADSAGNKLVLSVMKDDPEDDFAASGITEFTVEADAAGAALGLGAGPATSDSDDLEIRVSNPTVADDVIRVSLDGLTDIAQVIDAIEAAAALAGDDIDVVINEAGTGLTLIDSTFVLGGPNARTFMVSPLNGSGAAAGLGIAGVDSTNEDERDGQIDGGQLLGVKLTDRFFMEDATLVASLAVSTPGGIDAGGNFGFIGIDIGGNADLTAEFSVGFTDPTDSGPGADGKISLTEFINGLSDFGSLLAPPSLTGLGDVHLVVSLDGALPIVTLGTGTVDVAANLGDVFGQWADSVDLTGASPTRVDDTHFSLTGDFTDAFLRGARVTVPLLGDDFETFVTEVSFAAGTTTVEVLSDLPPSLTGLTIGTPDTPIFDFDSDLGNLVSFDNVNFNFASIIDALLLVSDLLSEIETFDSLLNAEIPLVDVSVNDLLEFADTFSDALTAAQNNPAASLQLLDATISEAFGVDPAGDLIAFDIDDNDTSDHDDDIIMINLNLGAAFSRSLNVRIPNLNLLDGVVDFGGAATLSAEGSAIFSLDIGVGLNNPTQFYIYETSGLAGALQLSGTDMAFKAGLGPLSLSIIEGQASIAGDVDVLFDFEGLAGVAEVDIDGVDVKRALLNGNIGNVLGTMDVVFAAPIDVTLPIYFPTESHFVGDVTLTGDLLNIANGLHVQTVPAVSSGTATGGTADTLTDTAAHFDTDGVAAGDLVLIVDGAGAGQTRVIESQTATELTLDSDWDVPPDSTSVYAVFAAAGAPVQNGNADADDDIIVLDVSEVLDGLASGFENLSLLDQILFIVDGVDVVLGGVQDVMDGEVFGFDVPLIGDKLAGAADVIGDFRVGFLNDFRNEVEKLADPNENGIKDILVKLLGPTGMGLLIGDIETFNNLGDPETTIETAEIWWKLKIGQSLVDAGADIGFDIGIPGLGLETQGEIQLNIDWELDLGFGLSGADGFFFFVDDEGELELDVDVTLPGGGLKGTLGFLEFTALNKDVDEDGDETHLNLSFAIDIANGDDVSDERLGLSELGRMGFDVLVGADASVELGMTLGIAGDDGGFPQIQADFLLDWGIDGDPDEDGVQMISLFNPPAGFDFGSSIQDGLQIVEFRNISLDVGSYISNVVSPLLEKIQEVTEPVQPIIDIVTTPLPVLSDLGLSITLLDIAKATGAVSPGFITALETILDVVTIINSIDLSDDGSLLIPLGDFTIYEKEQFAGLLGAGGALSDLDFNLGSGNFDLAKFSEAIFEEGLLADLLPEGPVGDILGEVAGVAGEMLTGLAGGAGGAGAGGSAFSFPILQDPSQVFGMLMGKEAVLIAFDMPKFSVDAEFSAFFSIFGPLGVSINLEALLNIDFAFGYDTKGFKDFAASDFRNPLLLANGLYISDDPTDPLYEGGGDDPPELTFDGGLWAAAELNLGIARGGVGGGIFIGVDFNLFDNDGDGRVRLDELFTNFTNQLKAPDFAERFLAPLAVFDVTGQVTAELFAFLKIDFGFYELNKKFLITPPLVLADFEVDFFRPPVLAYELDNGDLILNIGEFAKQRNLGDLSDFGEHIRVEDYAPGQVAVWMPGLEDAGADAKQIYNVSGKIIALGGEGDDIIDLSGVVSGIKFELDGGVGGDTIKGSGGGGVMRGGLGDDELWGGGGADLIFGNEGADEAHGGAGADIVFGDHGEVTEGLIDMAVRHGFARALIGLTDGADQLYGDGGDDIVAGSGAADLVLDGGADNDIVVGDGALFSYNSPAIVSETEKGAGFGDLDISGGSGADWLYGGKGNDFIYGNDGNDVVFGESGMDTIDGGANDDTLFGDFGKFIGGDLAKPVVTVGGEGDTIFGGLGKDKILGGGGNDLVHGDSGSATGTDVDDDLIWGGTGADTLHGDGGDDEIYGESDPDKLYGDGGGDFLEGGQGNDQAWGGTGADLLIAGYGSDQLDGESDSDTYRITARGGIVTELTTAYDSGLDPTDTDQLELIGTSLVDTVLLRGMADFYFPTQIKLIGDAASKGLTDKIFASEEPDKLRAILQALEDAYGPHDIPAGLVSEIIELYGAEVKAGLFTAIDNTYGSGPADGIPTAQALKDLIFKEGGVDPDTGILTTTSGLLPGKLEEIIKAIKQAYGSDTVPPTMFDAIATAWDTTGSLKAAIESAISDAYETEFEVFGSDTDTGFVALINNGGANVERFNYRNMEGLVVNTLSGNDYVVLDDVLAPTTVNLGLGQDRVQVGQVFRSERVDDPEGELITGITAEDVYTTLEITRGWLSNGISEATTINGGDDGDEFTVFHNIAVLNLNGGDGDDVFTVRAFALKGSTDSERARTDMKGDGGADTILYVVNAPVGIDGGDGFDTVRVVGTEFADDFVVTDAGIFGGGLNITYVNIEKVVADGAEGDDRFFIQSTGLEVVTEVDGGLGSDTFFVGGNPSRAPVPVISNDFRGHSGIILHSIEGLSDPNWVDVPIEGVSANVGDNEEAFVIVSETGGSSRVVEGATAGGAEWEFDSYGIRLTSAPTAGPVFITVVPAGMSPEDKAKGFKDLEFFAVTTDPTSALGGSLGFNALTGVAIAPVLEFNAGNWDQLQYVRFKAADDSASEGRRFVFINHTLKNSVDPEYQVAKTLSVKVLMEDDDRDGVIITPSGRGNTVLENGAVVAGFTDTFDVVLTHAPTADVTVTMSVLNNQVTLSQSVLTFTTTNWMDRQYVTITAPNDAVIEGFQTDYISYTVTSADVDQTRHSGGGVTPAFIAVDGNFDQLGLQAEIPGTKPTSYLLLEHKPIAGTVQVKINGVQLPDGTIEIDPENPNPLAGPKRFEVTGNTLTFLDAKGFAELVTGFVTVKYSYKEPGYNGAFVKDSVVDIYDEDTQTVIIQLPDDGSIDVIEGSATPDSYTIRLSQAPTDGEVVRVKVDAVDTRTTYGRTALFMEQVTVGGGSEIFLEFDSSNWFTPQTVAVLAKADLVFDGNDTQVFAPDLQTVNKIRGPLIIEGAAGAGSLSLPAPLMLPHELNILVPHGFVQFFTPGEGPGALETMRVLKADLLAVLAELHEEDSTVSLTDIQDLVEKTLELSSGPGTGVVLDPARPHDLFDRFWQILSLVPLSDDDSNPDNDLVELTLLNPSIVDPSLPNVTAPTPFTTDYAITSLSANFFAKETEQIDYLFMFDDDSVANDSGALTSADGVVRGFTQAATTTMLVEASALQAVARLDNIDVLVGLRIEISVGPGQGRSWTIDSIGDGIDSDTRTLVLIEDSDGTGEDPTVRSEFRIAGGDTHGRIVGFGMGPSILFNGRPQPGGISYGDIEVVQVSLGRGDDTVRVDYVTNAEDHVTRLGAEGDFYTLTLLDTGGGDDVITVKLQDGEDGAFSLNLNKGDDTVLGGDSTADLVVFGWDGADEITTGSGDDIVFGDRGRVDYIKTVLTDTDNNDDTPDVAIDQIVTRLGHSVPLNPKNPPVTSATLTTLTDATANFATDHGGLAGLSVQAISSAGHVQFRTIVSNTATTITIDRPWDAQPNTTYFYRVSAMPEDQTDGIFRGPRVAWTIEDNVGGTDEIHGGGGIDIVIGGAGGDSMLDGGSDADWVVGDAARFDFVPVAGLDGPTRLLSITTTNRTNGGDDTIDGGADDDIVIGGTGADNLDGGSQDDLIFGDNVTLVLNGGSGDAITPRFRSLAGTTIYDVNGNPLIGDRQLAPNDEMPAWADWTITLDPATLISGHFGDDYIAGGAGNDTIFGQLGNDTIQGDGSIASKIDGNPATLAVSAQRPAGGLLDVNPSFEATTDGDDYIEGNGGSDVIFGNLGQDDLIGGNSSLFSLSTAALRADQDDLIFGGAGSELLRNEVDNVIDEGDTSNGRDADVILGDNGNIYRLVGVGGAAYLNFNYDNDYAVQIIPRAAQLIDYTPGGPDFTPALEVGPADIAINPVTGLRDIGAGDELHGESGDDAIYGMTGHDVIFGEGQDDVLIAGYGDDWISGGSGDDGILGDDGRLLISRNSTTQGEPLFGIAAIAAGEINKVITAQNGIQFAIVNVVNALKYTAELTPDNLDPAVAKNVLFRPQWADDIIYGGLGTDAIHGGAGDDAISGAEAMEESYTNNYDATGSKLNGAPIRSDYLHPVNPGNVLGYQTSGANATKFALFDAANGLRKIMLNAATGALAPNGVEWLLNFNSNEGPIDAKWIVGSNHPGVNTDGDDHIFGDLGNDWLVGGSGRDSLWAGWGDDLMNADDKLSTSGTTDTNPSYEDLMYGGAGRDVMLINTNGDRAIDWVGEFNSYYTPFSQFGMASVLRLIQPGVPEYLLQLSKSQGADQTLAAVYGSAAARNGEPFGELGMVLQDDAAWGVQSGPPRDSQAGNSKGKVDVNRTAGAQPLYLSAGDVGDGAATLTDVQLAPLVAAAKLRLLDALGGDTARLAALDLLTYQVGSLPDDRLGMTLGNVIYLDADAAGHGWFVDATPDDDVEFISGGVAGIDLLSVLVHEMGHALGLEHADEGVMDDQLLPGERALREGWFATIESTVAEQVAVPRSTVGATNRPGGAVEIAEIILNASNGMATFAAGGAAALDSRPIGPAVSALFTGPLPVPGIVVEPRGSQPAGLGGSFVNLEPLRTLNLNPARNVPVSGALPDAAFATEASETGYRERSSRAPVAKPNAPVIDWGSSALDRLSASTNQASSVWLDDFLNHLGQTDRQRNPNAGIRVRPAPSARA